MFKVNWELNALLNFRGKKTGNNVLDYAEEREEESQESHHETKIALNCGHVGFDKNQNIYIYFNT